MQEIMIEKDFWVKYSQMQGQLVDPRSRK